MWGQGFEVEGVGFRVWDLGFIGQGLRLRVDHLGLAAATDSGNLTLLLKLGRFTLNPQLGLQGSLGFRGSLGFIWGSGIRVYD